MKLCKDCKHYRDGLLSKATRAIGDNKNMDCYRKDKDSKDVDMVTGETLYFIDILDASEERASFLPWKCGKKARYFEPK